MVDLSSFLNDKVGVVTNDGRVIVGTLVGFDSSTNLILNNTHERVFSEDTGCEFIELGAYIIRGDEVAIVGKVEKELDEKIDWTQIKAEALAPVQH